MPKNSGCTPWTRTGSSLKAYAASFGDVTVDFDLTYPVFFDEEGSVEFKYRKDSIATQDTAYGVFKFFIDDTAILIDDDAHSSDWVTKVYNGITPGFHTLIWRYSKLNILPFTEFMESEIEVITVKGRHLDKLTQCFPCRFGMSAPGSDRCEPCPKNAYFYVDDQNHDFFCAKCPPGTFSAEGSVGVEMCQPLRHCDQGDLEISYSKCKDGVRTIQYSWADHDNDGYMDCDVAHPLSTVVELPPDEVVSCETCTKGMERDKDGNCKQCPAGMFQPLDLSHDFI